jgi:hypothetical protein
MRIPKRYIYEVEVLETYIPENPFKRWIEKGEKLYFHARNKKELLKYFEDKAKRWVREGKIVIRRIGEVPP